MALNHSLPFSLATVRRMMLGLLVFQTSLMVLMMRYSRTATVPYLGSTVVFLTECLKYLLCLLLLLLQSEGSLALSVQTFSAEVLCRPRETLLLSVPAVLYTLQNNLLILALTNLDAATYQVTYQLKILTTAAFSVVILGKRLETRQWVSLVILTCGVALVQIPSQVGGVDNLARNQVAGLTAVLTACFSSGFAGVYYEKLVKDSCQPSLIIRNLQLGIFSLLFSSSAVLYYDGGAILQEGFFQGYTNIVVFVIVLQALGGLVVAATIKYADNILKGFATSVSILVSSLMAWLIQDLNPGPHFTAGTSLVIAATVMYCYTAPPPPPPNIKTTMSV